jgi:DNA repair exonuclease SbcCD nuclease subunit
MIFMLGDIHGGFDSLKRGLDRLKIVDSHIIQVGDFGIGFNPLCDLDSLNDLNEYCSGKNIMFYAIRGNHDDPSFFKGNHIYSNLNLLPDYSVLEIDDHKILCIGGATSIDRKRLIEKTEKDRGINDRKYWHEDEIFVLDESRLCEIENCDILVTHTAPMWCFPDNRNGFGDLVHHFAKDDPSLYTELMSERELLSKAFNLINKKSYIREHYYGHFHQSQITNNLYTNHYLLGVDELRMVEF